jgi:hypothetical protein
MSERGGGCFKGLLGDVKAPSTNDSVHPITGFFADQPYLVNLLDIFTPSTSTDFGFESPEDSMFHIHRAASEVWQHLLPHHAFQPEPLIPPVRVSLVAVRIRYLIEQLISVEVKVSLHYMN